MTDPEQPNREESQNDNEETQEPANYFRFSPMRPIQGYRKLKPIERFNFWIACFTLVLTCMAVLQIAAYIETERAYMIVEDVKLFAGEPSTDDGGLDMGIFMENVGKHLAVITDFTVVIEIQIVDKHLPDYPDYKHGTSSKLVVRPQVAQQKTMIPVRENKAPPPIPREDIIRGIKDGTIPLHIYGAIKYRHGYFMLGGVSGYCFTYIPVTKRRINKSFNTCENQNYTYAE